MEQIYKKDAARYAEMGFHFRLKRRNSNWVRRRWTNQQRASLNYEITQLVVVTRGRRERARFSQ